MKNLIQSIAIAIVLIASTSFAYSAGYDFTGTYGVCDSDHSQIKLTLNEDHTFNYQDFSNPDNNQCIRHLGAKRTTCCAQRS